jgi:prenyltransferase beta subunit
VKNLLKKEAHSELVEGTSSQNLKTKGVELGIVHIMEVHATACFGLSALVSLACLITFRCCSNVKNLATWFSQQQQKSCEIALLYAQ